MSKKRVQLKEPQKCVLCGEELPAGMTAYQLSAQDGEGYQHYGKCKGVQREVEILKSMRVIVDYLYADEEEHYEETPEADREKHIFVDIKRVDEYLKKMGHETRL